jgi:DNA-binding response OmpR family regulator
MASSRRKILVVEDDHKTSDIVRLYLERDGYQVLAAYDGVEGLQMARSQVPDLVVLDLLLPGLGGLDVCRAIRRESAVPIIMLTALTTENDKLEGLDIGADDYVTKPFSPRELAARVRVVLRRTTEDSLDIGPQRLDCGALKIDFLHHRVEVGDEEVHLTPTEFRILAVMARESGRVFSRGQLVDRALGYDFDGMERTVDVHILNLRRKIEGDPNRPQYIKTIYGMGYKFGG